MGDFQTHGVLEQCGDSEPVGQCAHHAAFGRRPDVFQPRVLLLERERHREDHRHRDQQRQGQPFHAEQRCRFFHVASGQFDDGGTAACGCGTCRGIGVGDVFGWDLFRVHLH
ncbi:hypothetical protein D3C72_2098770 [compost metagenome]